MPRISVVGLLALTTACQPPADTVEFHGDWPAPGQAAEDRLSWNRRTLTGAYLDIGQRHASWDAAAIQALDSFARIRAQISNPAEMGQFTNLVRMAVNQGCPDPLLLYLNLRVQHGLPGELNAAGAEAYRALGETFLRSGYPAIRRFYASLRAAQAWQYTHGYHSNTIPILSHFRRGAFHHLSDVLRDHTVPIEEVTEATRELLQVIERHPPQETDMLPVLEDALQTRWPEHPVALAIRGRMKIRLAWIARGGGFAHTVSPEGWRQFKHHLEAAEQLLETSWSLQPSQFEVAFDMMRVELGQGRGLPRLDTWFQRAITLDPLSWDAYREKLWYLMPRWHGSAPQALAFGRSCLPITNSLPTLPLILVEAHRFLSHELPESERDSYWTRPGVWEDVHLAYQTLFQQYPEVLSYRHWYARDAHRCGKFNLFLEILPSLHPLNPSEFGGTESLQSLIAEAEKATHHPPLPQP
jgi:hypothetical protein